MQCPYCGESVSSSSRLCPRCGEWLDSEAGGNPHGPAEFSTATPAGHNGNAPNLPRRKQPALAFLLELAGYVGFLGIGHMYAGAGGRGILLLFAWWGMTTATVTLLFVGRGLALLPVFFVLPVVSGLWARRTLEARAGWR